MKMNRTLAYGLACLQILSERGRDERGGAPWVAVREIARREKLPAAYCNKVLQSLVHAGLVKSTRGRGYRLSKSLDKISVWDVMEAFTFNGAPNGTRPERSLVLYESLREQVNRWLVGLTLEDVVEFAREDMNGDKEGRSGRKEKEVSSQGGADRTGARGVSSPSGE